MSEKNYQPITVPAIEWGDVGLSTAFGELVVQPLEPGYGITFGNALRRVLLSSVEGAAVTSVIVKGVNNEFGNVDGLVEDVLHLLLNIKKLVIKNSSGAQMSAMSLHKKGPGVVVAGDIVADEHLEILNKDLVLGTLAEGGELDIEFFVEMGRGYCFARWPDGVKYHDDSRIYLDAMFSPIRKVAFDVEKTRVGKNIDHDKLILKIHTNGVVAPTDALRYAVSIIRGQLEFFISEKEITFGAVSSLDAEGSGALATPQDEIISKDGVPVGLFLKSIDDLELSVREHNCLISAGVDTVLDLVNLTEDDTLKVKNFGRKSLKEVKEVLSAFNLKFGMNIKEADLKKAVKEKGAVKVDDK